MKIVKMVFDTDYASTQQTEFFESLLAYFN